MEHIVIVAGVSPSNAECIERLHLHSVVVGTATHRIHADVIMSSARELQALPATAGHWLMRSPSHAEAGNIGESCRFLFTAVRETHFVCEPEILWQNTWYDTDHLEYAVIVQYKAVKPMLGIGKLLRLMLCLCGTQCSPEKFRKIGAITQLLHYAVHGIVVLSNEEHMGTSHIPDRGGRSHIRDSGAIRDGAPSPAVAEALLEAGVCHERYTAGGSDMYVLGSVTKNSSGTRILALPQVQAKPWRNVTSFWVGQSRGGRSEAATAKRMAKRQQRGHPYELPRRPHQLWQREYRTGDEVSPSL